MRKVNTFAGLLFGAIVAVGLALAYAAYVPYTSAPRSIVVVVATFVVASIVANAIKVADPWDRAVVLRLGRFPPALEDARSMQAQEERERPA